MICRKFYGNDSEETRGPGERRSASPVVRAQFHETLSNRLQVSSDAIALVSPKSIAGAWCLVWVDSNLLYKLLCVSQRGKAPFANR